MPCTDIVRCFRTTDGEIFTDPDEAMNHQDKLDNEQYLREFNAALVPVIEEVLKPLEDYLNEHPLKSEESKKKPADTAVPESEEKPAGAAVPEKPNVLRLSGADGLEYFHGIDKEWLREYFSNAIKSLGISKVTLIETWGEDWACNERHYQEIMDLQWGVNFLCDMWNKIDELTK